MPRIPASIGLPDTARYRPYSVAEAIEHYDERLRSGSDVLYRPIATGFRFLDQAFGGGLRIEDLVVYGGKANVGKTIKGLQIVCQSAELDPSVLGIYVCYEHSIVTLLQRVLCQASVQDPDAPVVQGVTRNAIEAAVQACYARARTPAERRALDMGAILERVPGAEVAWWRLERFMDRVWLIHGDSLETTLEHLHHYVTLAKGQGFRRIVLIVDYVQRMPLNPLLMQAGLSSLQQIDLLMRGLKGLAMSEEISVGGVVAADEQGVRQDRVHLENLWGPSTMQYEPDAGVVLNKDGLTHASGAIAIRESIEKNRNGQSDIEARHWLHGAHYHLSPTGQPVAEEESFQLERQGLRRDAGRPGVLGAGPQIAFLGLLALSQWREDNGVVLDLLRQASRAEDGGQSLWPDMLSLMEKAVATAPS